MTEIRSYRRVFDLERRIYSIDRVRLNPSGVPVRGVLYMLAAAGGALAAAELPLVGGLIRVVPWYLRDLVIPGVVAAALAAVRIDGRPFHLAGLARLRLAVGARTVWALQPRRGVATRRWRPPDLLMLPDGSDSCLRAMRYTGPGAVMVLVEHVRAGARERDGAGWARRRMWPGRQARVELRSHGTHGPLPSGRVICIQSGAAMRVTRPTRGQRR